MRGAHVVDRQRPLRPGLRPGPGPSRATRRWRVGLLARVLVEVAHARQCAAGRWVLNEKHLLADAGLVAADRWIARAAGGACELAAVADEIDAELG